MSAAPVFATKWEFLYGSVLIAVDRTSGVFLGGESAPGEQAVCVWTTDAGATEAVPESQFDLREIRVRDLLAMLPAGIGVVVDPGSESGMAVGAAYVVDLKRYTHPFPAGAALEFKVWQDLPAGFRASLTEGLAERPFVEEVRAFLYTVDDGPYLGCLAYVTEAGPEGQDSAVNAIHRALETSTTLADLGVASVSVLALADVPEDVRTALPDATLVHRAG